VVPDRDEAGLEQAVAYVVPKDGADPSQVRKEIRSSLRQSLAPYKRPSRIELIDALPTTSTGKLARFELRNAQGSA
jgi:acyl-coenzyme A synthetase/AMP-(fatty) acid ligase